MTHPRFMPLGATRPNPLAALPRAVARAILDPFRRASQRRRTMWELSRLDDRMLADIGLTRGEIHGLAHRLADPERPVRHF